jgi:hypothetical protein
MAGWLDAGDNGSSSSRGEQLQHLQLQPQLQTRVGECGSIDGYLGSNEHGGGMNECERVREECREYRQVPGGF